MENKKLTGLQETYLDLFRIVAALFVVIGHSFSFYELTFLKNQEIFPYIQNIGVVMLFMLAGFLMAHSITNKNKYNDYSFAQFVIHKFIRIMKEYIPGLTFIALIDLLTIIINGENYDYYNAYNFKQFLGNIFMLQGTFVNNIKGISFVPFGSGRPLWTLSIEWWFYLLFACVYLILANKKEVGMRKLFLIIILAIMPIDYIIAGRGNGLGLVFGLGIMAYCCYDRIKVEVSLPMFFITIAIYVCYGIVFKEAYTIYSFIILWCIFCMGLKAFEKNRKTRRNIPVSFFSKSTFMLYYYPLLYHGGFIMSLEKKNCWLKFSRKETIRKCLE